MKKSFILIALMLLGSFFVSIDAQEQEETFAIGIIKIQQDDKTLLENTKPNIPNTPKVPDFILKDKSDHFILAIGGYFKPIMGWDLGNDLDNINFIPALIPVPSVKGQKSDFFLNPLKSQLDMQVVGLPGSANQVVGYVSVKYEGNQHTIRVSDLYVTYRGFTAGRVNSIFTDGASVPTTIDPQGPAGAISVHTYQVAYNSKAYNGFSFGIGMEQPTFDNYKGVYKGKDYPEFDGNQFYGDASQSIPDFPGYIQYKDKNKNRIRVAGLVRNFRYVNIKEDRTHTIFGWGIELSGNLYPVKGLTLYYQGSYGKGIANYYHDLNGLPLSYIPKKKPLHMKSSPMMGWVGGVRYKFSEKISSNIMFSQNRVWKTGDYYPGYRNGLYGAINIFYDITSYLQCGMEYLYGQLETYDKGKASDNRILTCIRFSL